MHTYDKANQLVSSTTDGKITHYAYDAAGRLIKEGDKSYSYGWLDKVLSVTENGQQIASFNYHNDGQIAQAIHNGKSEDFLWDGLALIHRGETSFINEPYVTGGNPILSSKDGVMFNDMLGSTLNIGGKAVNMTAFGESADTNAMYTGKPYIGELGYAFLFRNYRSDYGKWQTTDPLGYPDGWNNLAYCNNEATIAIDGLGLSVWQWVKETALALSYGMLYVANTLDPTGLVSYYFIPSEFAFADTYSPNILQNHSRIDSLVNSYFDQCFNYVSDKNAGTYVMPAVSPIKIDLGVSNAALGAIVGSGYLHMSGVGTVTVNENGIKTATVNLNIRYTDTINWNSKKELKGYFDPNSPFWVQGVGYVEVGLSKVANGGSYNVNSFWSKSKTKKFE